MFKSNTSNTTVVGSNIMDWRLGGPEVIDQDPTSTGSYGEVDPVMVKISRGQRILALDGHDGLLGLGVAADQLLVQAHGQREAVVDGTEGDGGGRGDVGGEAEQVLVRVAVPE